MSPVTSVLIGPTAWEHSFDWSGFFIHSFLSLLEVWVLGRLSKRKIKNGQPTKLEKGGLHLFHDELLLCPVKQDTQTALMVRFWSRKRTVKSSLVKLIYWLSFCRVFPFETMHGFWFQSLQAKEQSLNKFYKFKEASQGSPCCLQKDCFQLGSLF